MFKRNNRGMVYTPRQIKRESKKYRGWDYCEIYQSLGLSCEPTLVPGQTFEAAEQEVLNRLKKEIDLCFQGLCWFFSSGQELSPRSKEVLLACRAYTYAAAHLKNSHNFKKPVWKGLCKVNHDEEFLRLFRVLFPYIWD